jgi:hypothetical protein
LALPAADLPAVEADFLVGVDSRAAEAEVVPVRIFRRRSSVEADFLGVVDFPAVPTAVVFRALEEEADLKRSR